MKLMRTITAERPILWGTSIIGFGRYRYRYDSGRRGEMPLTGVAPRKQALSIYIMDGVAAHATLLSQLGKHKVGKSCLYVKRLEDIDRGTLERLITESVAAMKRKYQA